MGQYYKAVCVDTEEHLDPHNYDNGAKLMEHSYVGNLFVWAVEKMLSSTGPWYRKTFVWAGDYADPIAGWDKNWYEASAKYKGEVPGGALDGYDRWVMNWSKFQCCRVKAESGEEWEIHPLPLLTCDGNGRGGGDFHGENEHVGAWAGDIISINFQEPDFSIWKEIKPEFKE